MPSDKSKGIFELLTGSIPASLLWVAGVFFWFSVTVVVSWTGAVSSAGASTLAISSAGATTSVLIGVAVSFAISSTLAISSILAFQLALQL